MNKHNSVTSTYYLLLKNKKNEFIKRLEKQGKNFNKYYAISNEKQELMDILMNFEPSTKKKNTKKPKVVEIKDDDEAKIEIEKSEMQRETKKVNNIEIIPKAKSQERRSKRKEDLQVEFKTIDYTEKPRLKKEKDMPNAPLEFQTVDYHNTRNNPDLLPDPHTELHSKKKSKEISYIKNRRTGSTNCTNNKLNKREVKRISNFHKKAVMDLDTDEGEIIVSNRRN